MRGGFQFQPTCLDLREVKHVVDDAQQCLRRIAHRRDKRALRRNFSLYLAPSVIDRMEEQPPVLGGEQRTVTIFFSDLDSGPNTGGQKNHGAWVTIWGKGFGAERGGSTVTIGGGNTSRLIHIAATLGRIDACTARQGHVALIDHKRSRCGMYLMQREGHIPN